MFLTRRPSPGFIESFLRDSQALPLSYGPVGMVRQASDAIGADEAFGIVGRGPADFVAACAALAAWQHFDLGWVETFPRPAPIAEGAVVAVLIRHLGLWSLNGCRVLYLVGGDQDPTRFGFAYGTLTNHAESGEELFELLVDPRTEDVVYHIRAVSSPQSMLARFGLPFVRVLQARFRTQSIAAMQRAVAAGAVQRRTP